MIANATMTPTQYKWLERLNDDLPRYLQTLQSADQPGRFLPCVNGVTEVGRQMALGFSCFALKLYYTLGLWQGLEPQKRMAWIAFLKSFQVDGSPMGGGVTRNAFIDPPVMKCLAAQVPWHRWLVERVFRPKHLTFVQRVIISETKQAIATLAEIGETTERPYRGFPVTPAGVRNYLLCLDWTQPWGAGGRSAALVVFLKTESPRFLEHAEVQGLLDVCSQFFESLADVETGAYFTGSVPGHGQLVNGAMKVLTSLDWLEVPIHYPETLIDTCLERLPSSDGCHLVDAVYVLYRCLQQTQHKKAKIQAYCAQMLDMIKQHHNPDGGFSYNIGRSQTDYYGVRFSQGLTESDIHGTCLLAWAVAMIFEILEDNRCGWQVIKP
jgi:hypothetical protein